MTLPVVSATATPPQFGPCHPWTTNADTRARCNLTVAQVPDAALDFGIQLASLVLWSASGRVWGLCRRTLQPCWDGDRHHSFQVSTTWPPPASYRSNLMATTVSVTASSVDIYPSWPTLRGCSCSLPELILPGPIAWVEQVRVDGVPLALGGLKIKTSGLHARRSLIRTDGESWPCCNDLERDPGVVPLSSDGCPAWDVTYYQGREVDTSAQIAAQMLAEQLARQYCRDEACDNNLVQGLTQVARRGVVKTYDPKMLVDEDGQKRTGLQIVDDWLEAVNPHGRRRPPKVLRADSDERRRLWSWVDAG